MPISLDVPSSRNAYLKFQPAIADNSTQDVSIAISRHPHHTVNSLEQGFLVCVLANIRSDINRNLPPDSVNPLLMRNMTNQVVESPLSKNHQFIHIYSVHNRQSEHQTSNFKQ